MTANGSSMGSHVLFCFLLCAQLGPGIPFLPFLLNHLAFFFLLSFFLLFFFLLLSVHGLHGRATDEVSSA
ncbi:hypothetical protein BKA57DRAFT_472495 [Linnemannia elongata]|nr:hypothetical protein BKA57DRAFT_472495 [Linnemannia elongata]